MNKKKLFLLSIAALLILSLPMALAAEPTDILSKAFKPFKGFSAANLYTAYWPFLDFIGFLLLFISVAQFSLSKVYKEGSGASVIPMAVGIILAVAASVWAQTQNPPFRLSNLGPYALALGLVVIAYAIYQTLSGMGIGGGKAASAAWAFVAVWGIFMTVGGQIIEAIQSNEESPLNALLGLGNIAFIFGLLMGIWSMFSMFRRTPEEATPAVHGYSHDWGSTATPGAVPHAPHTPTPATPAPGTPPPIGGGSDEAEGGTGGSGGGADRTPADIRRAFNAFGIKFRTLAAKNQRAIAILRNEVAPALSTAASNPSNTEEVRRIVHELLTRLNNINTLRELMTTNLEHMRNLAPEAFREPGRFRIVRDALQGNHHSIEHQLRAIEESLAAAINSLEHARAAPREITRSRELNQSKERLSRVTDVALANIGAILNSLLPQMNRGP